MDLYPLGNLESSPFKLTSSTFSKHPCPRQTLHTRSLSTASPPHMDDGFIKMDNTKTYTASTSTVTPLLTRPKGVKNFPTTKAFDSFRSGPSNGFAPAIGEDGRSYNPRAAAYNTANTILVRRLKGRHLQMIAIGGSIGTFHPIFSHISRELRAPR